MLSIVHEISPCSEADACRNSTVNAGPASAKCGECRLAPYQEEYQSHFWSGMHGAKHPALVREKKDAQIAERQRKEAARRNVDKGRQNVLKKAVRAEARTERKIIKSTKNSGRSFRDGDHVSAGSITLDTKMQSKAINPVVNLEELSKVRRDATRAGNSIGGLVLRNGNGVGVVVFAEEDYALLAASLK